MVSAVLGRLETVREDEWERTLLLVYALTGESISYKDLVTRNKSALKKKGDWGAFTKRAETFFKQQPAEA